MLRLSCNVGVAFRFALHLGSQMYRPSNRGSPARLPLRSQCFCSTNRCAVARVSRATLISGCAVRGFFIGAEPSFVGESPDWLSRSPALRESIPSRTRIRVRPLDPPAVPPQAPLDSILHAGYQCENGLMRPRLPLLVVSMAEGNPRCVRFRPTVVPSFPRVDSGHGQGSSTLAHPAVV